VAQKKKKGPLGEDPGAQPDHKLMCAQLKLVYCSTNHGFHVP
jgi:hypothetical protein